MWPVHNYGQIPASVFGDQPQTLNPLGVIVQDMLVVGVFVDRSARPVNEYAVADDLADHGTILVFQTPGFLQTESVHL